MPTMDKASVDDRQTPCPSHLLGDIDEGGGGQLREGVQGDDHHGGGGVGVDPLLQQLSAAGRQAGVVMHVLQHGDQLQLQVHWCSQAYTMHRRRVKSYMYSN